MCGLFGVIRNDSARNIERATAAFVELGRLAVERGSDASGFVASQARTAATANVPLALGSGYETDNAGLTIVKGCVPFGSLWNDGDHARLLASARVVIGHTRWATQGAKDSRVNASPLAVGTLVGTHNGDVDVSSIVGRSSLPHAIGSTDTERLYQAMSRDRRDRRKVVDVLAKVEGRAALAWIDRDREDRVYLARAAMSPLSLAWDCDGNLYWASNPEWFRKVDQILDGAIGFKDIVLVREGTLLTINVSGAAPVIEDQRTFHPICRDRDAHLGDGVIWRGFTKKDMTTDKAQANHRVARSYSWGKSSKGSSVWTGSNGSKGYTARQDDLFAQTFVRDARPLSELLDEEVPDVFDDQTEFPEVIEHLDEAPDEVSDAVLDWADQGCPESLVVRLRNAVTEFDELAIADQLDFAGGLASVRQFRAMVLAWAADNARETAMEALGGV